MPWVPVSNDILPFVVTLQASSAAIVDEFQGFLTHHNGLSLFGQETEGDRHLVERGTWDEFVLYQEGTWRAQRCALLPTLCKIADEHYMKKIVALPSEKHRELPGQLTVLRLAPNTHLFPHHGSNARLVVHLPLVIPPHCAIRVAKETRSWQVGQALVLDDSFEHEAWNNSTQNRFVLMMSVWHPCVVPAAAAPNACARITALARRDGWWP
jgi:aspartate beta-hydroxylase